MDPGPFLRDQPVSAVFALTKMHLQSACQNHAMPGNLSLHVSVLAYTIYIRNFGKEIFMNTRTMLILYLIVMNLIGLSAMVIDKIRAMERRFRIPESVLIGGRYDKLMRRMKKKSRAIGFAIYMDTLSMRG